VSEDLPRVPGDEPGELPGEWAPPEVHADAASYALDALDPGERAAFEEHLATCSRCRRDVTGFQQAAAAVVLGEPVPAPPASLRAAVLDAVRGVEQLAPLADGPPAGTDDAAGRTAPSDPLADELALRRANRRARLLTALVAAVTVVALALGLTVWSLVRREPPVAVPAPTVTQTTTQAVPQVDPSLLAAPDVRIYRTSVNGASASFVVSRSQNKAVFVSADLPAPPAGSVYHLWTLDGSTVRPDNTFTTTGGAATQEFSGPVGQSTNLAINVERAGTDPQTPTPPVLRIVEL
jgi:anti-sigma factor RsiW